ncbi:hypothetical protein ACSBR2_039181 [Camellia fascicularis]
MLFSSFTSVIHSSSRSQCSIFSPLSRRYLIISLSLSIEDSVSPPWLLIFPSFPFAFSLNPIFSTGFVQSDASDVIFCDTSTIWVDSIKKKRKRNMNKYKKLWKRLSKHS